jgi:nucleoside-diphosphate-sugar epimerase
LENLSAAIEVVLKVSGTLRRPLIAADLESLTVGEMVAAMRDGLGRRPNMFPAPPALIGLLLRSLGQEQIYRRMSGSLVADSSALRSLGWAPSVATRDGLCQLMRVGAREASPITSQIGT